MGWMGSLFGYLGARWEHQRLMYSQANDILRNYDAGKADRLGSGWTAVNLSGELADRGQRDTIRARAQDLERNSDIAESAIQAKERHIIGTHLNVQSLAVNAKGKPAGDIRAQFEEGFEQWCRARNCDLTQQQTAAEMARTAIRRRMVDGGCFFIKTIVSDRSRFLPYVLQGREVSELDSSVYTYDPRTGRYIFGGIEFDEYNRPVMFYFKKMAPDGMWLGTYDPVPARRVIFLWNRRRFTQLREMSEMATAITRIAQTESTLEAVNVGQRIAACFAAVIKRIQPFNGSGLGRPQGQSGIPGSGKDEASGYNGKMITPGMLYDNGLVEDVKTITPPQTGQNISQLIALNQRLVGAGLGLSYEATSRDLSRANYGSLRQGCLEDGLLYDIDFQWFSDHFLSEVYADVCISQVLNGKVEIPDFWANSDRYLKHRCYPPGMPWIDPQNEATANEKGLNSKQTTLAEIHAAKGGDWQDAIGQWGREQEALILEEARLMKLRRQLGLVETEAPNGTGTAATAAGNGTAAK